MDGRVYNAGNMLAKAMISPTSENIVAAKKEIDLERIRIKAELILCEGRMKGLQALCSHPNSKTRTYGDYGGGIDAETSCPDCGYHS